MGACVTCVSIILIDVIGTMKLYVPMYRGYHIITSIPHDHEVM